MSLNELIQEKACQLTQTAQGISHSFPDTPWTPGHSDPGRRLRMIAYEDMTAED